MNRRIALERVALILGGTVIGGSIFLQGCKTSDKENPSVSLLGKDQIAFLDEVAETIMPTTNTPGAKAAMVGSFMNIMVTDCYEEKDQKIFMDGLGKLDEASKKMNGKSFMDSSATERTTLLKDLNKQLKAYDTAKKDTDPAHYFGLIKQLTLLGYFTSEIGATQALRYVAIPGKYEGCVPYKKGDRAWA